MKKKVNMKHAALLQFASKYMNIGIQLIITAVLARLISPDDFGLLSIVSVFSAFFQLFSDMGIGAAIVQYRNLTEEDYGKLFVFSCFLAIALMMLFCLAASPISWFYRDNRLTQLCYATAPAIIFNTLNMVPNGLMLKDKRFGAIALRLVVSTFLSGLIAILLALLGFGCYALAAQSVLTSLIILAWNLILRPVRHLSIHFIIPLKRIFSYSAYQFGYFFINYFSRNLDSLVIGRILGTTSLGYYDKAYKLTTYPMSSVSSVIASVVQPYMAENQDHPSRIFHCWYKITKLLSLVGAFISAIFIAAAPEITTIFYGHQWEPAIPLFQALSISIYFQMICNPSGAFFQSLGRTDLMFRQGLICTAFTAAGLSIGIVIGSLQAVAVCVSIAFCLQIIPITYLLLIRGMHVSAKIMFKFFPEILISIISVIINLVFSNVFTTSIALLLFGKILVSLCVFFLGYICTGNIKYLVSLLKR